MTAPHEMPLRFRVPAVLIFAVLASNGYAEEDSDTQGVFSLEPALGLELRYDENIFKSATSVQSSLITMISPKLVIAAEPSKHRFAIEYNGDFARYSDSGPDDYEDHHLEASADLNFSKRSKLELIGSYDDAHDDRGTVLTEGFDSALNIPPSPDEYELQKILGRFTLGSGTSKGRLVFEGASSDLEYTNHRDRTRFFDRSDVYGDAAFYYSVAPKISLLFDARLTDIDYSNDRPLQESLNSREYRYRAGVTWDTSAKTKGTIRVGYVQKEFTESALGDFSDPSWEVDVRWSFRSYSHFDVRTARYPSETNGGGNFVDNTLYSVAWEHEWGIRLKSRLVASDLDRDYRGSSVSRQQQLRQYKFSLSYQMRRWLSWKAGVEVNSRTSNIQRFEFDGNIYSISLLMTLY